MSKAMKRFVTGFALYTLAVATVATILFSTLLNEWFDKLFVVSFVFIAMFTILSYSMLLRVYNKNSKLFHTSYLFSITARLIAYLMFMVVCLLVFKPNAVHFLLSFLVLYMLYLGFEVVYILRIGKKEQSGQNLEI